MALVVKLEELGLVDGSNTELTLDSGDQGGTLEESTSEGLKGTRERLLVRKSIVKTDDADVFLSGALLRLDKTGGTVDADNETTSDLGIQGSRVTSLLATEDSAHPRDDFMRGWVGRLVQVDDTRAVCEAVHCKCTCSMLVEQNNGVPDVRLQVTLQRADTL
jgi:hypothetical protein